MHDQPPTDPFADPFADKRILYAIRGRPGILDRPTLPSGHPETWGAITDGTVLDQSAYPYPVFTR